VSRVQNADDFLLRFRAIRTDYQDLFATRITAIRAKYTKEAEKDVADQALEAHARAYMINGLLAALNWRLDQKAEDGLPNIFPEVPVLSKQTSTIRFLDYLGLERQTDIPLLIVETKRPNAQLPHILKRGNASHVEIIGLGLAGEHLIGDWDEWLGDLKDYVRSVFERAQKVPDRAVIANGEWLIIFLDPADAFLESGSRDPSRILVFADRSDIERRFNELYQRLEYEQILGKTRALTPVELPFFIAPEAVDSAIHGLRLRYIAVPRIYNNSPVVNVAPVVFIHSRYGSWLRIEAPPLDFELPHQSDQLPQHLNYVDQAAKDLLARVNACLGTSFQAVPIQTHYADEAAFESLQGVIECQENDYLVVTGDKTHYLLSTPSVSNCPYHDWAACNRQSVPSNPGPIMIRSVSPRSFFISEELHHCAHRDVTAAKATSINSTNRTRCGPRSGLDGQAFCEIWRFEQHLCCRTCVFEEVCTKATVFQLPCQR